MDLVPSWLSSGRLHTLDVFREGRGKSDLVRDRSVEENMMIGLHLIGIYRRRCNRQIQGDIGTMQ